MKDEQQQQKCKCSHKHDKYDDNNCGAPPVGKTK
jgi:hypothetical protein